MKTAIVAALFCIFFSHTTAIYDFKVNSLDGTPINFADYKGKKILIVNTASKSPYTFQMEELEKLYRAYKGKLVVVAFPAGADFGDQELKTNRDIKDFFTYTYDITFPITEKTTTIGSSRHPVYSYLISEAAKLGMDDPVIKWNFTKFLLDEKGDLIKVFPADVTPLSTEVTSFLNNTRNWQPR
jgi:glutathione peroxidase